MAKDHWLTCDICKHEWIDQPFANLEFSIKCPECNSEYFEIGDAHKSFDWTSPFWVVLLIPNFLLF
jgi:hypothetical protein